jgi:hypothetical protein
LLRHVRPSVCPSVWMYQRGSYWTDVCEICYCRLLRKSVSRKSKCG